MADASTNKTTAVWRIPSCTYANGQSPDKLPGPRAAHSCDLIGNKLYVFGGWNGKVGLNDLHVLDTSTMEWSAPTVRGDAPCYRNNHATFVYGTKLFVHGGHNHDLGWLADMYMLDTQECGQGGIGMGLGMGVSGASPRFAAVPGSALRHAGSSTSWGSGGTGMGSGGAGEGEGGSGSTGGMAREAETGGGGHSQGVGHADVSHVGWPLVGPGSPGVGPGSTGVGPGSTGVGPGSTGIGPAGAGIGPAGAGTMRGDVGGSAPGIDTGTWGQGSTGGAWPSMGGEVGLGSSSGGSGGGGGGGSGAPSTPLHAGMGMGLGYGMGMGMGGGMPGRSRSGSSGSALGIAAPSLGGLDTLVIAGMSAGPGGTPSSSSSTFHAAQAGSASATTATATPTFLTWSQPLLSGQCPSARACHTLSLVGRKVYCFGGYDGGRCFADLDVLDLDTMSWLQPRVHGTPPCPRNAQTVTTVGAKLFLFGGHSGTAHLRDLHVLDTESLTWTQPDTRGTPPPGLRGHTANLVGHKIVLFGGFDGRGRSNSLYVLDTAKLRWDHPATGPDTPAGRQRHTAVLVSNRSLFLLGGFNGGVWLADLHVLDVLTLLYGLVSASVTAAGQEGLLTSMRTLVNNPSSFPDVVFLVEGTPVYAHRSVLSTRCAHYKAMFGGGFREGGGGGGGGGASMGSGPLVGPLQDPIPVPDWSRAAVLAMLEFLYTGTVQHMGPDTAVDALGLADVLGLPGLAALADAVLQHAIDGTNVCTVLAAAHQYGAVDLKGLCLDFLLRAGEGVDLGPLEGVPGLLVDITRQLLRAQRTRL